MQRVSFMVNSFVSSASQSDIALSLARAAEELYMELRGPINQGLDKTG